MGTMNVSLPEALKAHVEQQVQSGAYGTSSEYVRELIRKDRDRVQLRSMLLEGAASEPTVAADSHYFDGLRQRIAEAHAPHNKG